MQKSIEPGCLVMCTAPDHFGFTTTAIRRVDRGDQVMGYLVNKPSWVTEDGPSPTSVPVCPERYLMRIDDYAASADETEQEVRHDAPAHA
ncbi:hypothetical protein [Vreelandella sp. GE22]